MPNETRKLRDRAVGNEPADRLNSWKEIAGYLKHSERTVRRWEGEGLPVHRHPHKKKPAIYAYKAEIDVWWNDGRARLEGLDRSRTAHEWRWSLRLTAILAVSGIVVAVLFGFGTSRLRGRLSHKAVAPSIRSIAVLPLENLSRDPDQEYFAEGMTDELITDLAQIHALRVISRNSVMQYKGKHAPTTQIARELNVDVLVEGTVLWSADRVRITAQLIDAKTDRHLWAQTYERDLRDVLALQDEVARAIANQVEIKLTPQEQARLSSRRPVTPAAHESYLRGLYELHGLTAETTESLKLQSIEKAIAYFQQALAQDPNDALAYAGLADAYYDLSPAYRAPLDVMPKAKAAALKAIEIDDSVAEAHAALGYLKLVFDWDWPRAENEFRMALDLNPSLPRAHAGYAQYLLTVPARSDEAIQEVQRAYALDPLLPLSHADLAWFLFNTRRYRKSIEAAQKTGHEDHVLALCYAELGQRDAAIASADRAERATTNPVTLAQIASAYALAGSKDKARELLRGVEKQAAQRYLCGFNVATVYAALDEKERAFLWLEKAYHQRSD
jgi:TolB-like protein